MGDFLFDPLLGRMHQVLDLRQKQHALTTTNLANADTPGFRAKAIEFDEVLSQVFDQGLELSRHHGRHVPAHDPMNPEVVELAPPPWSADGNSVVAERETARLKANALMYRAVSKGMSRHMALLKYAAGNGK